MATNKKAVYVETKPGGTVLKYGYQTSQQTYTQANTDLNVKEADGVTGVVFGCNSPKPTRMIKITPTRSFSSFASDAKVKAAASSGDWKVSKAARVRGIGGKLRKATFVPIVIGSATFNYGFYCDANTFAQASAFGASQTWSESEAKLAIWGVNSHKPARAYGKPNTANANSDPSYSFYIDATKIADAEVAGFAVELPYIA